MNEENFDNNEHEPEEEPQDDLQENNDDELEPTMNPVKAGIFGLITVFLLYQFGGAILTFAIFGFDFENANVNAVRLLTTGSQVLLILLPGLMFAKLVFEDVGRVIRIRKPDIVGLILFIVGFLILTPLLQCFLYIQNYIIEHIAQAFPVVDSIKSMLDQLDTMVEESYGQLLASNSFLESIFIVIVVAVTPAICEEVFFRGFVQFSFEQKMKPFIAAFLTAIFFGMYHFSPYGLIGLIALGLYFGYAAYMSDSIFVSMILHFLNNFLAISLYLMLDAEEYMDASSTGSEDILTYLFWFIFLSILFFLLIFGIKKYYHSISLNNSGGSNDMS